MTPGIWIAGGAGLLLAAYALGREHGFHLAKRRYIGELRRFERAARRWVFLRPFLVRELHNGMWCISFDRDDILQYWSKSATVGSTEELIDRAIDRQAREMRIPVEDKQAK